MYSYMCVIYMYIFNAKKTAVCFYISRVSLFRAYIPKAARRRWRLVCPRPHSWMRKAPHPQCSISHNNTLIIKLNLFLLIFIGICLSVCPARVFGGIIYTICIIYVPLLEFMHKTLRAFLDIGVQQKKNWKKKHNLSQMNITFYCIYKMRN